MSVMAADVAGVPAMLSVWPSNAYSSCIMSPLNE